MSKLTSAERDALPAKSFAGPGRSYPIPDANHARNALARAAQHASNAEQQAIAEKVHSKFPNIAGEAVKRALQAKKQ